MTGRTDTVAGRRALRASPSTAPTPVLLSRAMSNQRTAAVSVWPLQSQLELGVLPTAVPCARAHTRLVLAEWGLRELADPAELVVSKKLVTNGIRASSGLVGSRFGGRWSAGIPPVRLWLLSDCRTVLVQVWDGNNRMPTRQELDPESEARTRAVAGRRRSPRIGERSSQSTQRESGVGRSSQAMTSSSITKLVIVIVVITSDCDEDPASPVPPAARPEPRTRQDHAQAGTHPPWTPGDDTE